MMALVEEVRTMDLAALGTPVLVLHGIDDQVVDLDETRRVFATLPARTKRMEAVEDSDDPYQHVIAGRILSPGSSDTVVARIVDFVSGVVPVDATR
jgi:dipeptidyl aminopeptidase/acylaminoacyl peptidase